MFLANDRLEWRHKKIRSFLPREPVIAILLTAVDFEWSIRRSIIALGTNSNRHIRDSVLRQCHGADAYKEAWKIEVKNRLGRSLAEVVPNWEFIRKEAFVLRHQVVHGDRGLPSTKVTAVSVAAFLAGSVAIEEFARNQGIELFGARLPIRRKARQAQ